MRPPFSENEILATVLEHQSDPDPGIRLTVFGYGWLFDTRTADGHPFFSDTHKPAWKLPTRSEIGPR